MASVDELCSRARHYRSAYTLELSFKGRLHRIQLPYEKDWFRMQEEERPTSVAIGQVRMDRQPTTYGLIPFSGDHSHDFSHHHPVAVVHPGVEPQEEMQRVLEATLFHARRLYQGTSVTMHLPDYLSLIVTERHLAVFDDNSQRWQQFKRETAPVHIFRKGVLSSGRSPSRRSLFRSLVPTESFGGRETSS